MLTTGTLVVWLRLGVRLFAGGQLDTCPVGISSLPTCQLCQLYHECMSVTVFIYSHSQNDDKTRMWQLLLLTLA